MENEAPWSPESAQEILVQTIAYSKPVRHTEFVHSWGVKPCFLLSSESSYGPGPTQSSEHPLVDETDNRLQFCGTQQG